MTRWLPAWFLLLAIHGADGTVTRTDHIEVQDRPSCMAAWEWYQNEGVHAQCVPDREQKR